MSYCPATPEDLEIYRRMSPGVRAVYALGEVGDWVTTFRVEAGQPHKEYTCAFRATVGLPGETRMAFALWVGARIAARVTAAQLAEAEEALA